MDFFIIVDSRFRLLLLCLVDSHVGVLLSCMLGKLVVSLDELLDLSIGDFEIFVSWLHHF